MEYARIKLAGRDTKILEEICENIKEIAGKYGASVRGPVPLPTKRMKLTVMKTPCGDGMHRGGGGGNWETWEMRIHKRVLDVGANERALRQVVRIAIPEGVKIDIELK